MADNKNFLEFLELASDAKKYKDKIQQLTEQEKAIETRIAFDSEIKADSSKMLNEANEKFREAEEIRSGFLDRENKIKAKEEELNKIEKNLLERDLHSEARHKEVTEHCDKRMTELGLQEARLTDLKNQLNSETNRLANLNNILNSKYDELRKIVNG